MDRPRYYKLVGHQAVGTDNMFEWARYFDGAMNDRRRVDLTYLDTDVHVSTVFLGLDHNFTECGPPILFETMIFGSELNLSMRRYSTWDEAAAGIRGGSTKDPGPQVPAGRYLTKSSDPALRFRRHKL